MNDLQALLDSFVERQWVVGANLLVYQDGSELFSGCAGRRDACFPAPFDRETVMRMYSMTKVVTAASVMRLWEQNRLSPDLPVSDFIPEYGHLTVIQADGARVDVRAPLTIRHLLTMTSGIPYPDANGNDAVSRAYLAEMSGGIETLTTLDLARKIAACPLCFEPGEKWMYGLSADVLGGVIVACTGMEPGEYMKKEIFDKLGMADTGFRVGMFDPDRLAALYQTDGQGKLAPRHRVTDFSGLDEAPAQMGGAGLLSTVSDFARFGEMLRLGGGDVLTEASVREMTKNQLTEWQLTNGYWDTGDGYGYGYLVRTLMDEGKNAAYLEKNGAFGWNGMGGTTLRIDPARRLTVVLGMQRIPPEHGLFIPPLMREIAKVING